MKDKKFFTKIKYILNKEPKLIEIKMAKRIVFVGDTHGDLEVSQKVIKNYLSKENKIVFLGDYVDRGDFSRENLDYLLEEKLKFPNQIYLCKGNHESHKILEFSPADFWESLSKEDYERYCSVVEKFPLVVVAKDIIALHGALPDVKSLLDINKIETGDKNWLQICWGDFVERQGKSLGFNPSTGRPEFGKDWFFELMRRFNKKILIRSHQPNISQFIFKGRCLTIFNSSAYDRERTIAIADLKKEIKTAKDLEIIRI